MSASAEVVASFSPTVEIQNDDGIHILSASLHEVGAYRGAPMYELHVDCAGNATEFDALGTTLYVFPEGKPKGLTLEALEELGPTLPQVVVHGFSEAQVTTHINWSRGSAYVLLTIDLEEPVRAVTVADVHRLPLHNLKRGKPQWLSLDMRKRCGRWFCPDPAFPLDRQIGMGDGAVAFFDRISGGGDAVDIHLYDSPDQDEGQSVPLDLDAAAEDGGARYRDGASGTTVDLPAALMAYFRPATPRLWLRLI